MSRLNDAKSLAHSYLDEVHATIAIRLSYNNVVIGMAGQLMGALGEDKVSRAILQEALKHKTSDPSTLYRSMIVQINGVFENYIRSLAAAVIEEHIETAKLYDELQLKFRNAYISHAAQVLTHIKAGNVQGVAYNFDDLLKNLGKGLSGQKGYRLNAEVYTMLMGNCTAGRLEKLFDALSLPKPFSDSLGTDPDLKAHFEDKTKGRVAKRTEEMLDNQINLRNDIVHGDLTRAVDQGTVHDTLSFFRALISGLTRLASSKTGIPA